MTQITQRDIALMISMFLALVLMNFTASAAGLTGDNVDDNDIPTLNMSEGQFDFAQDFPDKPSSPTEGTIVYEGDAGGGSVEGKSFIWLDGDESSGTSVELLNDTVANSLVLQVAYWNGDAVVGKDTWEIAADDDGREIFLHNTTAGWGLEITVVSVDDDAYLTPTMSAEVDFEVFQTETQSEGGLRSIPLIGDALEAGDQIIGTLGWVGLIIRWAASSFIEAVLNAFVAMFNVAKWIVALLGWMFGNFTALADASDSWATQLVYVPLLILSALFAKMALALVSASDWL